MKKVFLLIFLLISLSMATQNHRVLSAPSRVTNNAGWSLGAPSATDTLIWDGGTGYSDTMGVGWKATIQSLRIEHGMTNYIWGKNVFDTLTINGNVYINKGSGYWYPYGTWIQNNNSNFWMDTCTGMSNNNYLLGLIKKGTDTIKSYNGAVICGDLTCAYPGQITYFNNFTGAGNIGQYTNFLKLMGGTFNLLGTAMYFNSDMDSCYKFTSGSQIICTNGGGHFATKLNGATHHIPKINAQILNSNGTTFYTMLAGTQNIYFTDSITVTTGGGLIFIGKVGYQHNFRFNDISANVGSISVYSQPYVFFNNSTVNCTSMLMTVDNDTGNVNLDSTNFHVAGSWTNTNRKTIIPGTSVVAFTSAATITSANKSFNKLILNAPSHAAISLADSLKCNSDFIDSACFFSSGGFNLNLGGDFYRYSLDSAKFSTSRITTSKPNALWYRRAAYSDGATRGVTLISNGGTSFNIDSNMQFYRIYVARSKTLTGTAGVKITDSTYTAGDFDSISVVNGRWSLPANTRVVQTNMTSVKSINKIYDTSATGLNFGGDSNIVFKSTLGYYLTPATVTVTSLTKSSGACASFTDTAIGTGFFPPCSVSVDGAAYITATSIDSLRVSFTMPTVSGGIHSVTIKNLDSQTGTKATAYTAIVGPITPTVTRQYDTTTKAIVPITISNIGCTADSFNVAPALVSGLSISKSTGTISGTPTAVISATAYTVTGYGVGGNATALCTLSVISADTMVHADSISPKHTTPLGGTSLTLYGRNLGTSPTASLLGNPVVSYTSRDSIHATFLAPSHASGSGYAVVTSSRNGSKDSTAFTYDTLPVINSASPSHAPLAGGGLDTLTGSGLDQIDTLWYGVNKVKIKSKVYSMVVDTIPTSATAGKVAIRSVSILGYHDTLPNGFEYKNIWLTSVTPSKGELGDTISIHAQYGLKTSGLGVKFGTTSASVIAGYTDTMARVIVPAGLVNGGLRILATNSSADTCTIGWTYGKGNTGGRGRRGTSSTGINVTTWR